MGFQLYDLVWNENTLVQTWAQIENQDEPGKYESFTCNVVHSGSQSDIRVFNYYGEQRFTIDSVSSPIMYEEVNEVDLIPNQTWLKDFTPMA